MIAAVHRRDAGLESCTATVWRQQKTSRGLSPLAVVQRFAEESAGHEDRLTRSIQPFATVAPHRRSIASIPSAQRTEVHHEAIQPTAAFHRPAAPAEPIHGRVAVAPVRGLIEAAPVRAAALTTAADGEPVSLKQQVALLRREVAEIRQHLARLPSAMLPAEAPPKPPTDPETRLEAERVEQQRIAGAESAFRNEAEDARWSRNSLATVRTVIADADASLLDRISSIECRSRSCRVVMAGNPGGLMPLDLTLVIGRLAATLPNVTAGQIDLGDGRTATVLYLSRSRKSR